MHNAYMHILYDMCIYIIKLFIYIMFETHVKPPQNKQ